MAKPSRTPRVPTNSRHPKQPFPGNPQLREQSPPHPGGVGSVQNPGNDGKGCFVCLEFGHSRRVIRFCHAWLINSDRSVRIPRLIVTACPLCHIVVRKKEKRMVGKKEIWLLVILICCFNMFVVPCKSRS